MDRLPTAALLFLAFGFSLLLAACGSLAATPSGPSSGTPRPPASSAPVAPSFDIEQPGRTASAGQVDTEWGPIWESTPEDFPVHPRAVPTSAPDGPVSAAYTVARSPANNPRAIAQFYGQRFSAVGWGGGVEGPLEDGSYEAWASSGYGCDMVARVVPRGFDETFITILYGAGCPSSWPSE
jgi:hypothetical protein